MPKETVLSQTPTKEERTAGYQTNFALALANESINNLLARLAQLQVINDDLRAENEKLKSLVPSEGLPVTDSSPKS